METQDVAESGCSDLTLGLQPPGSLTMRKLLHLLVSVLVSSFFFFFNSFLICDMRIVLVSASGGYSEDDILKGT